MLACFRGNHTHIVLDFVSDLAQDVKCYLLFPVQLGRDTNLHELSHIGLADSSGNFCADLLFWVLAGLPVAFGVWHVPVYYCCK